MKDPQTIQELQELIKDSFPYNHNTLSIAIRLAYEMGKRDQIKETINKNTEPDPKPKTWQEDH